MKDVHGARIRAIDLMSWVANNAEMHENLLIIVGEDGPDGEPGQAALMVWHDGDGADPTALDVPVFTRIPEFYSQPDAPKIDYPVAPDWAADRVG